MSCPELVDLAHVVEQLRELILLEDAVAVRVVLRVELVDLRFGQVDAVRLEPLLDLARLDHAVRVAVDKVEDALDAAGCLRF